ncbi:hypothetical protein BOX15_Mlig022158g3, partial [Macrostomum lignano]
IPSRSSARTEATLLHQQQESRSLHLTESLTIPAVRCPMQSAVVALLLAVAVLTASGQLGSASPQRQALQHQQPDMDDLLPPLFDDPEVLRQYLRSLNGHYATLARPRYGKRSLGNSKEEDIGCD